MIHPNYDEILNKSKCTRANEFQVALVQESTVVPDLDLVTYITLKL